LNGHPTNVTAERRHYVVVGDGPHPNQCKAAERYRLRMLAIDGPSATVVRRFFAEYMMTGQSRTA